MLRRATSPRIRALGFGVEVFGPQGRTALTFGDQKINLHEVGREFEPRARVATAGSGDFCLLTDTPVDQVAAHLVATGAVAIGDDLIGSIAGGGVLSKLSRRFGEGVINGALTARVGVAAMEVCRPMPFDAVPRPNASALVRDALTGIFGKSKDPDPANSAG